MLFDMSKAAERALSHVNVSFDATCRPAAFEKTLVTGVVEPEARAAMTLFLDEGDEQMIVDIVTDGTSTFDTLHALAEALLPAEHPTILFLREPPQ